MRLNRQDLMQRAQALLDAKAAAKRIAKLAAAPREGLERFWSSEAVAEYERYLAGGPLPESAEALEILAIDVELEHRV